MRTRGRVHRKGWRMWLLQCFEAFSLRSFRRRRVLCTSRILVLDLGLRMKKLLGALLLGLLDILDPTHNLVFGKTGDFGWNMHIDADFAASLCVKGDSLDGSTELK